MSSSLVQPQTPEPRALAKAAATVLAAMIEKLLVEETPLLQTDQLEESEYMWADDDRWSVYSEPRMVLVPGETTYYEVWAAEDIEFEEDEDEELFFEEEKEEETELEEVEEEVDLEEEEEEVEIEEELHLNADC